MNLTLNDFEISRRWPARRPGILQLYSSPTQNGVKVSAMLEEIGMPYEAHLVDLSRRENDLPSFLSLNPNGKIPAIIDPNGPDGRAFGLFESGAILLYLAEKSGQLLPECPGRRMETIQWVYFQTSAVGPMFGQLGYFFKAAGREVADKRPLERYRNESIRLLRVLEARLTDRKWVMGDDFTIADLACFGPVYFLVNFYEARELVEYDQMTMLTRWVDEIATRPAIAKALSVPSKG